MAQNAGYSTANFPLITSPASLGPAQQVSVDTLAAGGAAPQTIAPPLGLISHAQRVNAAVTAFAGGGKASATQLDYGFSNVTVVATAADSVKLPPAVAGAWVFIRNSDAADSVTVFAGGTSTIDGVATGTGNAQAAGKGKLYVCVVGDGSDVAGVWVSLLGA